MKVEGPGKTGQTNKAKKKGKTSGAGGFGDLVTGGAEETKETATTRSIAKVDSLLAIQEVEDPTERATRRRMHDRADAILDELEKLRLSLLMGDVTVGQIIDIADVVASHREKITDPELTAILDEVDLRAQIELAKMRKALDNQA